MTRTWRAAATFLIAFVAVDWVSFFHPMSGLDITPWNPQAALAVAFMLWWPRAWSPVFVAVLCADALVRPAQIEWPGTPVASALQTAGYALIALGLRRWIGPHPQLRGRKELVSFLLVITAGALLSALLHVAGLAVSGRPQPERIPLAIYRAWIGDGVGLLVTLPFLFMAARAEQRAATRAMARTAEFWAVVLVACAGTFLVFSQTVEEQFKFFYVLFLPVAWGAARFGVLGAVGTATLVQLLLAGAVQSARYRPLTVFELQILMAALAATGLLLGTLTEEREEAARKLRLSLRTAAAGDMAAALAHELNQPLAAMTSYARAMQLLVDRLDGAARRAAHPLDEVSAKLVREAARAGEVVKRLRNFFRDQTTELQPTPLPSLLREVAESQRERASGLGVRLEWDCPQELPALWLDPVQIAVVLRNLIANALEAASAAPAPAGGAWVQVHATLRAEHVVLDVLDSGAGLVAEDAHAVFEDRRSAKPGGMGVGLAISRAIVEAHGGQLWAEPGPGGRFFLSLPISAAND
ncbi:MAG: ATP-binding protein [Pseudomonadota bacterium]